MPNKTALSPETLSSHLVHKTCHASQNIPTELSSEPPTRRRLPALLAASRRPVPRNSVCVFLCRGQFWPLGQRFVPSLSFSGFVGGGGGGDDVFPLCFARASSTHASLRQLGSWSHLVHPRGPVLLPEVPAQHPASLKSEEAVCFRRVWQEQLYVFS